MTLKELFVKSAIASALANYFVMHGSPEAVAVREFMAAHPEILEEMRAALDNPDIDAEICTAVGDQVRDLLAALKEYAEE